MELISVLIAVCNGEEFISETLESVRAQTHATFEIIVVDDGSTDTTIDIVKEKAKLDPRIILLQQAHKGVSAARNLGLAKARGRLVALLDSDDLMHPERLARQAEFLKRNPGMGFCASAIDLIDVAGCNVGSFTLKVHNLSDLDDVVRNRRLFSFTNPSVMLRKAAAQAVGGYRSEFVTAQDLDLFLRMHNAGFPGVAMPEKLTCYRLHLSSTSGSKTKQQVQTRNFLFRNFYAERDGLPLVDFATFLKEGSLPSRILSGFRLKADVMHQTSRYRKAAGQTVRGNALWLTAAAMKSERVLLRGLKKLRRQIAG